MVAHGWETRYGGGAGRGGQGREGGKGVSGGEAGREGGREGDMHPLLLMQGVTQLLTVCFNVHLKKSKAELLWHLSLLFNSCCCSLY